MPPSIAAANPSPNDPLFCSIHNDVVRSVYRFIAGGYCRRCRICHICIVCALPAVLVAMQCGLVFFCSDFQTCSPSSPPPQYALSHLFARSAFGERISTTELYSHIQHNIRIGDTPCAAHTHTHTRWTRKSSAITTDCKARWSLIALHATHILYVVLQFMWKNVN